MSYNEKSPVRRNGAGFNNRKKAKPNNTGFKSKSQTSQPQENEDSEA